MLSITDLRDFIDLDIETVHIVQDSAHLPPKEATSLARQLLASESGLAILHHMYRDQLAATDDRDARGEELRQAYRYFARKYPLPQMH